jgi:hypothetical protein
MNAQVDGLRLSLAIVAILALLSLLLTTGLPASPIGESKPGPNPPDLT